MIIIGLIVLIIGVIAGIGILVTLGVIVLLIGLVLLAAGHFGHPVRGRSHYW